MAATQAREIKKLPTLRGRTVVNLFFEDSTRTRISFEAAAKRLSADVINFSAKGSSVSKGESLKDTALTLQAMGADAVVIRHHASGAPHTLAHARLDRTAPSSTPATARTSTPRRRCSTRSRCAGTWSGPGDVTGRDLAGLRVAIVGDVLHSRVARSNVQLLHTLGAEVTLVAPPTLLPVGVGAGRARVSYDLDEVLADEKPRRDHDAARPARADVERGGVLPRARGVHPPLRARRAAAGAAAASTRSSCTPAR